MPTTVLLNSEVRKASRSILEEFQRIELKQLVNLSKNKILHLLSRINRTYAVEGRV